MKKTALIAITLCFAQTVSSIVYGRQNSQNIAGNWNVVINGLQGTIDFTQNGFEWRGTLNLDAGPEKLTDIAFNPGTGELGFTRPNVNQKYTGGVKGNTMEGKLDDYYAWSAVRKGNAPVNTNVVTQKPSTSSGTEPNSIAGQWNFTINGLEGTIQFVKQGGAWKGTLNLDAGPEPLSAIAYNPVNGVISFTRPNVNQKYTGRVKGNTMEGKLDDYYPWTGIKSIE